MPYQLLLADDSATIHRVVQITFATEDFQVTAVNGGNAAVSRAKELVPSVAVIDLGMPDLDGYTVCQAIKSDPATAGIPVLLLSGSNAPFDAARAQAVGANEHLAKPFETQALLDKVKTLVGAPLQAATPSFAARPVAAAAASAPAAPPATGWAAPSGGFGAPSGAAAPARPAPPAVVARPVAPPPASVAAPTGFGAPVPASRPAAPPIAPPMAAAPPPRPATAPPMAPPAAAPTAAFGFGAPAAAPPTPAPRPVAPAPAPTRPTPVVAAPASAPPAAFAAPALASPRPAPVAPSAAAPPAAINLAGIDAAARAVLEQVAWEVVPQLAETIIREHLDRLLKERSLG